MKLRTILMILLLGLYAVLMSNTPIVIADEDHHEHEQHEDHDDHDDLWGEHDDEEEHHGHIGEHGGQFGDASDMYHYEVLLDEKGDVIVYMYDGKARRISDIRNMEVRWTLNPDSEYPLKGVLDLASNQEYFMLDLPRSTSEHVSIKIEAEKDGKWWPVEFLLEAK